VVVGEGGGVTVDEPDTMPLIVAIPCRPLKVTATPFTEITAPVATSYAVTLAVNGAVVSLTMRVEVTASSR
jgi:hypothetical protein